ncbi:hypothetical protein FOZ62_021023, partial [Perkinsus olseni]
AMPCDELGKLLPGSTILGPSFGCGSNCLGKATANGKQTERYRGGHASRILHSEVCRSVELGYGISSGWGKAKPSAAVAASGGSSSSGDPTTDAISGKFDPTALERGAKALK